MVWQVKRLYWYWKRLGEYGILNIAGAYKSHKYTTQLPDYFRENAKRFPVENPAVGVTLVGDVLRGWSLSKTARDLAEALRGAGIPCQVFDTGPYHANKIPKADAAAVGVTPPSEFRLLKYRHIVRMTGDATLPADIDFSRNRVSMIFFWEFESGAGRSYAGMAGDTQLRLLAMSNFNLAAIPTMFPGRKCSKVLYPFKLPACHVQDSGVRKRYGMPADAFVVYFNFAIGSSYFRKNPEDALRAFAKAFAVNTPNATFLFKISGAKERPDLVKRLRQLANELGVGNRVFIETRYLPEASLMELYAACDVYLSLHRGEGFGITLAEAMSYGKPVVCTDYGSTTEFCKEGCSIPVPYTLVPPKPGQIDVDAYKDVELWATPSVDAAAAALRKLYDDPEYRRSIGDAGRRQIYSMFSKENVARSLRAFVES